MKQEPSILLLKGARTRRAIKRHGKRYEAGDLLPPLSERDLAELGETWVDRSQAQLVEADALGRELGDPEARSGAAGLSGQTAPAAGDEGKPAATNTRESDRPAGAEEASGASAPAAGSDTGEGESGTAREASSTSSGTVPLSGDAVGAQPAPSSKRVGSGSAATPAAAAPATKAKAKGKRT